VTKRKNTISKSTKALDEALNIAEDIIEAEVIEDVPTIVEESNVQIITASDQNNSVSKRENEIESDYDLARTTMRGLLVKGNEAIERILELAKGSEHPRVIEVAAGIIRDTSNVAKDLMQVHKIRNDVETPGSKGSTGEGGETKDGVTNVFIGSTADLKKAIDDSSKKTK